MCGFNVGSSIIIGIKGFEMICNIAMYEHVLNMHCLWYFSIAPGPYACATDQPLKSENA